MSKRLILTAAPLLMLAACNDEPANTGEAEQGGEAAGEVLGGTISDAMIPLEQLQSQSPPAERVTTTSTEEVTGEDGDTAVQTTVTTTVTNTEAASPPTPAPPLPPTTQGDSE